MNNLTLDCGNQNMFFQRETFSKQILIQNILIFYVIQNVYLLKASSGFKSRIEVSVFFSIKTNLAFLGLLTLLLVWKARKNLKYLFQK
jgi:hypothetical protein